MKKIISIMILVFAGIILSAQTDSLKKDSLNEVMPSFPGGNDAFNKFLKDSIRYPQAEKDAEIQGTVYVSFVVEKDGSISNVKIAKELPGAPGFSAEAVRVISSMPNWIPGKIGRVMITQPVRFVLMSEPKQKKKKH